MTEKKHLRPTLWIVGDSTVSAFDDRYYMPRYGWGTQLHLYLNDEIRIRNLAISGTSSKSFRGKPAYRELLEGISSGDFLMIGFGHNDEKKGAVTFTSPCGDFSTEGSFAQSICKGYIEPAQKAGAYCIVVTPIVRRDQSMAYEGMHVHVTPEGDYAEALRQLGRDLSIPVCDLTKLTKELALKVDSDDDPDNDMLFQHARTGSAELCVDDTHTSLFGAAVNAWLIAGELERNGSELGRFLKSSYDNPLDHAARWKEMSIDHSYQDPAYVRPSGGSSLWPVYKDLAGNIWYGSVFGDVNRNSFIKESTVGLSSCDNGAMLLSIGEDGQNGKIMEKSDGMAMYFVRIPAGKSFSLSGDVTVISFGSAGEPSDFAGFGAMVRDDMYVDAYNGLIMGDYVAAGITFRPEYPYGANTFARKSGLLAFGGGQLRNAVRAGDTIRMTIASTADGYSAQIDGYAPVIAGYDFALNAVDTDYVYAGFFAARSIAVKVDNIQLVIEGEEVHGYNCFA